MITVEKKNNQTIRGLSSEQISLLKERLTFDNPAYKNAKRYSRSRYISIPPYLTYYKESFVREDGERKKVFTVPIGVNVPNILKTTLRLSDRRVGCKVNYPKFNLELRKDQENAKENYLSSVAEDYPKTIVQLPTGKGKSILALNIAYTLGQKTLILVHKDDLVVGWQKDIKLCFDNIDVGLIKAKSRKVGEQITIATVQTLGRMSEEELSTYTSQFGLVVQDEVHHVGLNIFNVIDKFNSRYKLGLSATPKRSDGLDFVFDIYFGGKCYEHKATENDEDICSVEVIPLYSSFKYKPFYFDGRVFNYYDFCRDELPDNIQFVEEMDYNSRPKIPYLTIDDEAVTSANTGVMVCNKIIEEYNLGRSIIALFTQKEHINIYREYLVFRGVPENEILLYYGDNNEKSEVLMQKAESKECRITLATYAKATEGTNVKSWEVEFLVSSLNNAKNVEQATGRIRRRKAGKLDPVRVYDIVYGECYSLRSHFNTRVNTYRKLKYNIKGSNKSTTLFNRGYSKRLT